MGYHLRARAKITCAFLVTQRFRCEAQIRRQLISFQEFATKQMKMMCWQKCGSYFCTSPNALRALRTEDQSVKLV